MRAMRSRLGAEAYGFAPRGWVLPAERPQLFAEAAAAASDGRAMTYIAKPDHASQGDGISLARVKASATRSAVDAATLPIAALSSYMKDWRPTSSVSTDQLGFHVSGW